MILYNGNETFPRERQTFSTKNEAYNRKNQMLTTKKIKHIKPGNQDFIIIIKHVELDQIKTSKSKVNWAFRRKNKVLQGNSKVWQIEHCRNIHAIIYRLETEDVNIH